MSDDGTRSSPNFDALWQTVITDDANLQASLQRVAASGCSLLSSCTSASVTLIPQGRPITVGSTDDTALTLDNAQYSAGEGPCLAAARERRVVRIDDTRVDERWPRFASTARAIGVASSLSVPLVLSGDDTFGGLNIYGDVIGGFSDDDEQLAQAFAAQASVIVSNAHAYWSVLELSTNLTRAMETRAVIEQAKGVLMTTHQIDANAAFEMLKQRSQTANRKLREVAADVVNEQTTGDGDARHS